MKKLFLLTMLGLASAITLPATAQLNVSINIGSQPQWGPSGYNHVDYYYMPEIESYYYVPTKKFIYYSGNTWVHTRSLPTRYRNYDLYSGPKYVINSPRPYMQHNVYKVKYSKHKPKYVQHHNVKQHHVKHKGNNGHGGKHKSKGGKHDNRRH
ncbi:hypothetical protein [Pedobacter psychroterrae]|uniref:YXWGXW repeat-containing protein n=1 Tax=Pedobacter psychroterrae TaxID=2530453 RepID=A0A4R0NFT6_9SPHI|nr:hypothetical protein [Pedobacter psychroterrae]TCC98153.1 hypothetical protein EZ437_18325 [Pedobacter psychroterrae]